MSGTPPGVSIATSPIISTSPRLTAASACSGRVASAASVALIILASPDGGDLRLVLLMESREGLVQGSFDLDRCHLDRFG